MKPTRSACWGRTVRGLSETLGGEGMARDRLVKLGTLSKALGCQGGFVCGSRSLIDYLINHARPYIFSTALAPPLAAAARKAVALVGREPERRLHVLALAERLRTRLKEIGLDAWPIVQPNHLPRRRYSGGRR